MGDLARVEKVLLRSVWVHEQTGFSAWLASNIDLLNEQLPFSLDPESLHQEARAGAFSVDIVGDAVGLDGGEPFKVIIENQIEQTDHTHLGQVLTYVAAYGAKAAIWISASARPEHAKAIQWLNDESTIDAWLFDVEVIRIDGSRPAPVLTQIVAPSDLSRRAKAEKQSDQAYRLQVRDFWALLLPKLERACARRSLWQGRSPTDSHGMAHKVPGSPGYIAWQVGVTKNGSWICLKVDGTPLESRFLYDALASQRTTIDQSFGEPLTWNPDDRWRAKVVRWNNPVPAGFADDPDSWEAATDSLAEGMRRLVEATIGPLHALPAYVPKGNIGDDESVEVM